MIEAQTEWVKPTEFPDLRQADTIAISSTWRKSGNSVGFSHSVGASNFGIFI